MQTVTAVLQISYGVRYNPNWREDAGLGRQRQTGTVPNDDRVDWLAAYQLFPGDVAYVWHAGVHACEVAAGLEAAGFEIRSQIIWVKQHFALSRGDYHWQHEPCWYAVRSGKSSNWSGDRTQSTIWEVANMNPIGGSNDEVATGHSTQKPIELMRRPILNHTVRGDMVYDPFLGSGTTLIAAAATDRVCYGLDIEPRYIDLVVRRWQKFTGEAAILASASRTFDEITSERMPAKEEA
jgi:DNA modification methylase